MASTKRGRRRQYKKKARVKSKKHRTNRREHRTNRIKYRTNRREHRTNRIKHRTNRREHRTNRIKHSTNRRKDRVARGLFGLTQDKSPNSCKIPVKKCSQEYGYSENNCRQYYYLDKDTSEYRPCRNPEREMEPCRPTAKIGSYKCRKQATDVYRRDMTALEERLKIDEIRDKLDKAIRERIGAIYNMNLVTLSIDRIPRIIEIFPARDLVKDFPEVDFYRFIADFKPDIERQIEEEIAREIESQREIIGDDIDIPQLYEILKTALINQELQTIYTRQTQTPDFLKKYGIPEIIEKMERKQSIKQAKREQIAKQRLQQQQQEQELMELYREAEMAKPESPPGSIRQEPSSKNNQTQSISTSVPSVEKSRRPPSPARSVATQYSLHGNPL